MYDWLFCYLNCLLILIVPLKRGWRSLMILMISSQVICQLTFWKICPSQFWMIKSIFFLVLIPSAGLAKFSEEKNWKNEITKENINYINWIDQKLMQNNENTNAVNWSRQIGILWKLVWNSKTIGRRQKSLIIYV